MYLVVALLLIASGCKNRRQSDSTPTEPGPSAQPKKKSDVAPAHDEKLYQYHRSIGTRGTSPGQFEQPIGLAIDEAGDLYVSDAGNKRLQLITQDGTAREAWADGLERPMHLNLDGDGRLLVPVFIADRIDIFDGTTRADSFGGDWLDGPTSVTQVRHGRLFVTDFYNHQFHIVSPQGQRLKTVGKKGKKDGQFTYPTDVALASNETIWIADAYAHRLQQFDLQGNHLKTIGEWGKKKPGTFRVATGIDVGPNGRLYVADFKNHRVQILEPSGKPIAVLQGEDRNGDATMAHPTEVIAAVTRLYVVDHGHHQIDVYRRTKTAE